MSRDTFDVLIVNGWIYSYVIRPMSDDVFESLTTSGWGKLGEIAELGRFADGALFTSNLMIQKFLIKVP